MRDIFLPAGRIHRREWLCPFYNPLTLGRHGVAVRSGTKTLRYAGH